MTSNDVIRVSWIRRKDIISIEGFLIFSTKLSQKVKTSHFLYKLWILWEPLEAVWAQEDNIWSSKIWQNIQKFFYSLNQS